MIQLKLELLPKLSSGGQKIKVHCVPACFGSFEWLIISKYSSKTLLISVSAVCIWGTFLKVKYNYLNTALSYN